MWYSKRFWLRHPSPAYTKSERELHDIPVEVQRAPWSPAQESVATERTLDLPLQGVRESYYNISNPHLPQDDVREGLKAPGLRGQKSRGRLMKESEEFRDVKDIV